MESEAYVLCQELLTDPFWTPSLVVVPYVLSRLRKVLPHASATFDWQHPLTKPGDCCYLKRLSLINVRTRYAPFGAGARYKS